uniref:Interleukin n=1 Tax=Echeneis naucrates TaxID=173247 RepID=A0A665TJ90_ECHNA
MEQLFKLALWMFCLLGFLQAMPLKNGTSEAEKCYNLIDLDLKGLSRDVSCVSYIIRGNKQCYDAAMTEFVKELNRSSSSCTGDKDRPLQFIGALEFTDEYLESSPTTSFENFVQSFETFLQQLNSENC